jgi:hypothetical protein
MPPRLLRCCGIALAALFAALAAGAEEPAASGPVQAVEFPYYLYPRALWERELVWLKNIGVRTVEFQVPQSWHQAGPGECDFAGRTSPRRDLAGLVRILRKLGLHAWIRVLPEAGPGQDAWLKELGNLLATQTAAHGGPVAYVEGRGLAIDAAAPPSPVVTISATGPTALARSREAIAQRRSLLWTGVEDALYPGGWQADAGPLLRKGAVSLGGEERPGSGTLRRDAALLRNWGPLVPALRPVPMPKPAAGKFPEGVTAVELVSGAASAVAITNQGKQPFGQDLRVLDPGSKRTLVVPGVKVPVGESLWLPLDVSLGPEGLCRECSNFSGAEHIVYATAELLSIEFENGILAMEFAAPEPGEVILQLAREPVGPFLAAGKPTEFYWDAQTLRARLTIPAGTGSDRRVRIGIAMEEPETSAFFNEARRLIIGQKNLISTTYSSPSVAARSRLRLPEGFTAAKIVKSPNEIDYEVSVPADAIEGDRANLALEADGMPLGRARLPLFRPADVRLSEPLRLHFGPQTELICDPPAAAMDARGGANLEFTLRNNWPQIQTYQLQGSGEGLEFMPPKLEVSVGAVDQRRVSLRVFAKEGVEGLREWRLRVTGAANLDLPMRAVLLPRGRALAWSADLDGDGSPDWVLESRRVRAVFSSQDGGRWMEFTWKDTNTNFLPEAGAFAAPGPVQVRAGKDEFQFAGKGWTRTVRLSDATLTVEQTSPLPPDGLASEKRGNISLGIERAAPTRALYTIR